MQFRLELQRSAGACVLPANPGPADDERGMRAGERHQQTIPARKPDARGCRAANRPHLGAACARQPKRAGAQCGVGAPPVRRRRSERPCRRRAPSASAGGRGLAARRGRGRPVRCRGPRASRAWRHQLGQVARKQSPNAGNSGNGTKASADWPHASRSRRREPAGSGASSKISAVPFANTAREYFATALPQPAAAMSLRLGAARAIARRDR